LPDPEQWGLLDSIIGAEPCLRSQRGSIMRRNSCRNHWVSLLNARIYNVIPVDREARDEGASRWQMQLGARYSF
jgi:hypothetical protein